jgi:hypothetical protein
LISTEMTPHCAVNLPCPKAVMLAIMNNSLKTKSGS